MVKDLSPLLEGLESAYEVAFSHSQIRSNFLWENWSSTYGNNNKEAQAKPRCQLWHHDCLIDSHPAGVVYLLLKDEELPHMAHHLHEGVIEEGNQLIKAAALLHQL